MAVGSIAVDDATTPDKYLHTNQRTISSTAREDQYILPGENAYPTYSAIAYSVSVATTAAHVLQIMGDGTNYSRIKRIVIQPDVNPAAATLIGIGLYRLSTAGTGGGTVTVGAYDSADTYVGGAMTLPSSKGTEGAQLNVWRPTWGTAAGATVDRVVWEQHPGIKPIIFGPATSNGVAFKVVVGVAAATVTLVVEWTTTSYL